MRRAAPVAASLAVLVALAYAATPPIQPDAVLAHIKVLSADELQGRANGSAGLEKAAEYIAGQFKNVGLQPGGSDNDWFQPFDIVAGLAIGGGNELVLRAGGQ